MSKHTKPSKKLINQNLQSSKAQANVNIDLLQIIDNYFSKKQLLWFWIFFSVSLLFTFLLFDLRVSVGGDDSNYIIRAHDLINDFKYPSFQGPMYPFVLSIFVAIFGINLPVLKILSAIFLSGHLYFFFKAFKDRIPGTILISSIILISINSYLLFYGSQTYSEAFFLLVQMLFFVYFFKHFITENKQVNTTKQLLVKYFIVGSLILGLGLTKNIGYASLFAVLIYFGLTKNWKGVVFSSAGFFSAFGIWQLLKLLLWGDKKAQFSDQASTLFQKHPYDPSQGMETFGGFIQRFLDNSNIYLSRQLFKIFGLRPEMIQTSTSISAVETLPALTILVYALLLVAFIWSLRKNRYLLFTGVYLAVMMGITFIILQTIWEATRLIIAFFPLLTLYLMAGVYYLFKFKKLGWLQFSVPIVVVVLFFSTFSATSDQIKEHQKIFRANLRGNVTAGMTPDWVNYINMCKWAAENVPEGKIIACRKPSIAFIYTGRRFHGIYKVETNDPDSLINDLYKYNVEYVIMASLRKVEAKKTEFTINTIQRYLYFIQQKYPQKIKLLNQIGNDEPAYLFKIE